MKLSDLSPAMQKQALKAAGVAEKPKRAKGATSSRLEGWCVQCGERVVSEPAWDRHVAATGCRRNLRCWPPPSTAPRVCP